ncbi:MAG: MFS transporter [Anaerolineae bacterium]|nr:MFS transporter [Anaerolineae bacterium]
MWQNLDFRKLWIANSVSSFGSQITFLALPLTAVTLLHASPMQMGILAACGTLPFLLLSLPAGLLVDRSRRRPLLVAADLGRAALLGLIPLLAVLGALRIEYLYSIAFLTGALSLLYDITEETYLPTVVEDEQLVEGNSQLAAIDSVAELSAPVIAGGLVQGLTAPIAVAVDAASFLWSAFWLGRIQRREVAPKPTGRSDLWREMREGVTYLARHPLLRPSTLTGIQWQFFGGMTDALLILFLTETLGLPPLAIGLVYAAGSLSALAMTRFSNRATHKFGPGPVAVGAALGLGVGWLIVPLAAGTPWAASGVIAAGMFLAGAGNMIWNVTTTSITQNVTPNRLLGRVNACGRFLVEGALPIGALVGGALAGQWGVRPTLLLACGGVLLGVLWVWFSPLRALRVLPCADPNDELRNPIRLKAKG